MSHDAEPVARTIAIPLTPLPSGVLPGRTGWIRVALAVGEDVLLAIGVLLCIPLVILAIGTPIALALRLVLWLAGLL